MFRPTSCSLLLLCKGTPLILEPSLCSANCDVRRELPANMGNLSGGPRSREPRAGEETPGQRTHQEGQGTVTEPPLLGLDPQGALRQTRKWVCLAPFRDMLISSLTSACTEGPSEGSPC